jgi:hypothetical protein
MGNQILQVDPVSYRMVGPIAFASAGIREKEKDTPLLTPPVYHFIHDRLKTKVQRGMDMALDLSLKLSGPLNYI